MSSISISTTMYVSSVSVYMCRTNGSCTPCVRTRRPQESERWQRAANVRYLYAYAAYVSIRQHTSAAYAGMREVAVRSKRQVPVRRHTPAYAAHVSIRSIRQHTQHTPAYAGIRQHTSAYAAHIRQQDVSIRQHIYVSIRNIRQHMYACSGARRNHM